MSDYRATPEQWAADRYDWSKAHTEAMDGDPAFRCILELRTRIELLEATQHAHIKAPASAPAGSLVERVAYALRPYCSHLAQTDARTAIREVATWLEEEFGPQIDWITAELREEAADG